MKHLKKLAAGITTAAVLGYGATASAVLPFPSGVADGYLQVNNFTLFAGNGVAGRNYNPADPTAGLLPIGSGVNISVSNSGDTLASLNGAIADSTIGPLGAGVAFTLEDSVGAGFTAGSTLPLGTINPGNYAGSHSSTEGNALTGDPDPLLDGDSICGASHVIGDCVLTHNQVNLNKAGTGSGQSNNTLASTLTVDVGATGQLFEMYFTADLFLRAGLGQGNVSASASSQWLTTVRDDQGNLILSWSPDGLVPPNVSGLTNNGLLLTEGSCVAAGDCTVYSDDFKMSDAVSTSSQNDFDEEKSGTFEIELFLAEGSYEFNITHITTADVTVIPEPGTLALMGLGMLGAGVARRRTNKV